MNCISKAFTLLVTALAWGLASPASAGSFAYTIVGAANPFTGDLAQATASVADDPGISASFGVASGVLPNGFQAGDDFQLARFVIAPGGNVAFQDNYIFHFAGAPAGMTVSATPTVHFAPKAKNAIAKAEFRIWRDNDLDGAVNAGDTDEGGTMLGNVASQNTSEFFATGITPGARYILQVTGTTHPSAGLGAYVLSFASTAAVPLPPALALLVTGLSAIGLIAWRRRSM